MLKAQINTFSKQLDYKYWYPDGNDWNNIKQTHDKGYIIARTNIDSSISPTPYYCEYIKTNREGNVLWVKKILLGNSLDSVGGGIASLIQTADKGYLISNSIHTANKGRHLFLAKTDSMGAISWCKTYPADGYSGAYALQQTSDKGYIAAGFSRTANYRQSAFLLKTDSMGNYGWGKNITIANDTLQEFYDVKEVPRTGYVLCGYSTSGGANARTSAAACLLDGSGNLLWNRNFIFAHASSFYSVIQTSDNNFVFAGSYNDTSSYAPRLMFIKLDLLGNTLWMKAYNQSPNPYYGSYAWNAKPLANGAFIFSGYISDPIPASLIGKMDANGNLLWSNEYRSFHSFNYVPNTIETTTDGGYMFTNSVGIYRNGRALFTTELLKTDANGTLGCDGMNHPITLAGISAVITNSATVSPTGSAFNYTPALLEGGVKDSIICETITDHAPSGIRSYHEDGFVLEQNYPNPFSGSTRIACRLPADTKMLTLEVYDMLGNKIREQKQNYLSAGTHYFEINDFFAKGIFFYTICADGKKVCGKMISE